MPPFLEEDPARNDDTTDQVVAMMNDSSMVLEVEEGSPVDHRRDEQENQAQEEVEQETDEPMMMEVADVGSSFLSNGILDKLSSSFQSASGMLSDAQSATSVCDEDKTSEENTGDGKDNNDSFEPLPLDAADNVAAEVFEALPLQQRSSSRINFDDSAGMDMFWTRNATNSEEDISLNIFWTRNTSSRNNHDEALMMDDDEPIPYMEDDNMGDDQNKSVPGFAPLPLHEGPKLRQAPIDDNMNDHQEYYADGTQPQDYPPDADTGDFQYGQYDDTQYQNHHLNNNSSHHTNSHSYAHPEADDGGHYDMTWTRNPPTSSHTSHSNFRSFDDTYAISNNGIPLGEGGFGVVYSCVSKYQQHDLGPSPGEPTTKTASAVKIVAAENYNRDEIDTLNFLRDCPYVVSFHDIFFGFDRVYLVMEKMGGDLLTKINEKGVYEEAQAKTVMHTLLSALSFCHTRGVAHRDVKPENILIAPPTKSIASDTSSNGKDVAALKQNEDDDCTSIKLADFGVAKRFRDDQGQRFEHPNMFTLCGSPWYAAPEVFGRHLINTADTVPYDERCDIWSAGVIMYLIVGGYMPFQEATDEHNVVLEAQSGKFLSFPEDDWEKVSPAAKELIRSLLKVHPVQRCTLQEALEGPWIKPSPVQENEPSESR